MLAPSFVKTGTILDTILTEKIAEVSHLLREPHTLRNLESQARAAMPARDFTHALRRDHVALIAEVKKASPSKGVLIKDFNPVKLARTYETNGAAAISILTDERFFQGKLEDLQTVREAVRIPVLRKEFIIDAAQVYQARAAGADAVLLIVMALDDPQLHDLHQLITELGMAALVEVHNTQELERAQRLGASLIGVNNRDLRTFHEDLETTIRVAHLVSPEITLVAESAIRTGDDVQRMAEAGVNAILVGEGLVKSGDIADQVRQFSAFTRVGRQ
jgi:indole-3-glycerol phosphate synthase